VKEENMASLPPKMRRALEDFVRRVAEKAGDNLRSVILYGSAARGEFVLGRSDVNILVLLEEADPDSLQAIAPVLKAGMRRDLWPVVLSRDDLYRSLDVFPIDWFEMKGTRVVLYGDDPLSSIELEKEDMRKQLEFEARAKLIRLRQAYIRDLGNEKALVSLAFRSLPSFLSLFKAALFLKGCEIPKTSESVIEAAIEAFSLDREGLEWGLKARSGIAKKAKEMFPSYLRSIEQFVYFIDMWKAEKGGR
jgi:predicted nucleotidyltransferase